MILARGSFRFSELFANARTRSEVVVTFLAMLELTRLRQLIVTQGEDFGEIEIGIAPLEPVAETAQPAPAESVMAEEEGDSIGENSPAAPDSPGAPVESGAIPPELPAAAESPVA